MRKSELVAKVAEVSGLTQREVEKMVDALSTVIVETCVDGGDEINFPFGKFKQKVNPAKAGVNPLTNKPMNVLESHTLAFKASKTVKKVIDGKKSKKK